MKKVFLTLAVICFTSQALALTLTRDGILDEWVGGEINDLGTQAALGGSYTVLATWDGTDLHIGMDRDSSNRYLGDAGWDNDSFFIAIDTDGIPGSGADWDGYGRMQFNGSLKPDIIYYYTGGNNPGLDDWYERSVWNGSGWDWIGWTNADSYYGYQEANPDDELTPGLLAEVPSLSGANELLVWAWMTREQNGFVEVSWPRRASGFVEQVFGDPVKIRDEETRLYMPHDPSPALYEEGVDAAITVSWQVAQDSTGVVDPNLVGYKLYLSNGFTYEPDFLGPDPNLVYETTVSSWDGGTLEASATLSAALDRDALYFWRADTVLNDATEIEGDVWSFYTELTTPEITAGPDYQVVDAGGAAIFSVTVVSSSTPSYQWYKYVDGVSDTTLSNVDDDISGATSETLSIANVELADEGGYYCIVNNDSGVSAQSVQALLGVKRRIAYWDFESSNANSTVAGSPVSFLYGDPNFVTTGIVGSAMEFDNDTGAEDILYTDPDEASYFDICNYNMTVACWIKSSFAAQWGPMVARNGEDGEGWQLRHHGNTLDRICFTTRGTGNDDGTASNRTVYDGNWHYAVGTYDGAVKKVYIDGVLSRVYSGDDGSIAQESDEASGLINSSPSPVALAGRVKGDAINGLDFEGHSVTPCILDEVEIYNYALDAATIAQTYADIANAVVCPVPQLYDLDDDCVVNLSDLSRLASEWLSDIRVLPTL